jgi:hypothetical protein
MKNYLQLFVSALIISIFWFAIYMFANHILAAYLAFVFSVISVVIGFWIILKIVLVIRIQSMQVLHKADKRTYVEQQMYDTVGKTA